MKVFDTCGVPLVFPVLQLAGIKWNTPLKNYGFLWIWILLEGLDSTQFVTKGLLPLDNIDFHTDLPL